MDGNKICKKIGYGILAPTLTEKWIAEEAYKLGLIDGGVLDYQSSKDSQACTCGNKIFSHRHSNWIECTKCGKIKMLTP